MCSRYVGGMTVHPMPIRQSISNWPLIEKDKAEIRPKGHPSFVWHHFSKSFVCKWHHLVHPPWSRYLKYQGNGEIV